MYPINFSGVCIFFCFTFTIQQSTQHITRQSLECIFIQNTKQQKRVKWSGGEKKLTVFYHCVFIEQNCIIHTRTQLKNKLHRFVSHKKMWARSWVSIVSVIISPLKIFQFRRRRRPLVSNNISSHNIHFYSSHISYTLTEREKAKEKIYRWNSRRKLNLSYPFPFSSINVSKGNTLFTVDFQRKKKKNFIFFTSLVLVFLLTCTFVLTTTLIINFGAEFEIQKTTWVAIFYTLSRLGVKARILERQSKAKRE